MACTPEISGITSRNSPMCGSINKSLLTPCRRVGLSRKRKTPISSSQGSPLQNVSTVCTETTPVNYGKSVTKNSRTSFANNTTLCSKITEESGLERLNAKSNLGISHNKPDTKQLLPKKGLFQTYSEDLFNNSDVSDSSFTNCENIEPLPEDCEAVNLDQNSCTSALRDNFMKLGTKVSSSEFLTSSVKLTKASTDTISQDNVDSYEDFRISKKPKKQITKTLSLKKSTSSFDRDIETTPCKNSSNFTRECTIQLKKINENELNLYETNTNTVQKNRVTVTAVVDEEEDAFTSTPERERNRSNMLQKIRNLEKLIKQKRTRLADLKQASIYKNKHSIEDLNQLTIKWTTGCVLGLNDLLAQLQAHGPIDMTSLLNNLRIPSDIIVKLFPPNVE